MQKINQLLMEKVIAQQKIISNLKNENDTDGLIDLCSSKQLRSEIDIVVSPTTSLTNNIATYAGKNYRCSVGKNGTTSFKK